LDRSNWVDTVSGFGRKFKQAAGRSSSLVDAAARSSSCRRTDARRWEELALAEPHNSKALTGDLSHLPRLPERRSFARASALRRIDQSA
jgi:hypothetical protein